MNLMNFSKTVFKNLFSKPATRAYPVQQRVYPQRTRGHIQVDMAACVLCGLCAKMPHRRHCSRPGTAELVY